MMKQLKNRYRDEKMDRRFVVGLDKTKMRLYDVDQSAQDDINTLDPPAFDNTKAGKTHDFSNLKFN
jgi:hypothetical protein